MNMIICYVTLNSRRPSNFDKLIITISMLKSGSVLEILDDCGK